eukprot:1157241-Pelagomonas_calceolata.AAC.3
MHHPHLIAATKVPPTPYCRHHTHLPPLMHHTPPASTNAPPTPYRHHHTHPHPPAPAAAAAVAALRWAAGAPAAAPPLPPAAAAAPLSSSMDRRVPLQKRHPCPQAAAAAVRIFHPSCHPPAPPSALSGLSHLMAHQAQGHPLAYALAHPQTDAAPLQPPYRHSRHLLAPRLIPLEPLNSSARSAQALFATRLQAMLAARMQAMFAPRMQAMLAPRMQAVFAPRLQAMFATRMQAMFATRMQAMFATRMRAISATRMQATQHLCPAEGLPDTMGVAVVYGAHLQRQAWWHLHQPQQRTRAQ